VTESPVANATLDARTPTLDEPSTRWPASCRAEGGPERASRLVRWGQSLPDELADSVIAPPWMSVTDPARYLASLRHGAVLGTASPRVSGMLRELDVASRSPKSGWRTFNEALVADLIDQAQVHGDLEDVGTHVHGLVEAGDLGRDETSRLVERWKRRWAALVRDTAPTRSVDAAAYVGAALQAPGHGEPGAEAGHGR
jgi:hypothetical protein